jgi:hypothetical protein
MASFIVTTLADENDAGATAASPGGSGLSLREALALTNANSDADTITFDPSLDGATLVLTQLSLRIDEDVTIDGDIDHDGKADITISGNHATRLFTVLSGTSTLTALTMRDGGYAASVHIGGAIAIGSGADLTVLNSTLADNSTGMGGAIYNAGNTRVINSTLSGNSAMSDGGAILHQSGTLSLINATLSGNKAATLGGAIAGYAGVTLDNTTVAGNRSGLAGGGIATFGAGGLTITNSIVAANEAFGHGNVVGSLLYRGLNIVGFGNDMDAGDNVINAPDIAALFALTALNPHTGVLSGVLRDNGGPIQTIAIRSGGAATYAADASLRPADTYDLDHDTNSTELLPVDARGRARIAGGALDIGAFEIQDNQAPVNTRPTSFTVEANVSSPLGGLSVSDPDGNLVSTVLSVSHGSLTVIPAGGATVQGSGSAAVTISGTLAAVNATLGGNVLYRGAPDDFSTATLTVVTVDAGDSSSGNERTDTDQIPIHLTTWLTGTPHDDNFAALPGNARIDSGLGNDTITFGFKLTEAAISWSGNRVIVDGPAGSHTVLTGFESYAFTDGTVHNNDSDALVDDLFYYARNHDVWAAHAEADAHYHATGWHETRDPNAFFSTATYLSANPDVRTAGVDPLAHWHSSGWAEGRVPSIGFDPRQYLAANADVRSADVDPLAHYLQNGAQEGRTPFAAHELLAANGFDYVHYLQNNPDVAAAHIDPLLHFATIGWREGRNPNALFDVSGYLAAYADVAAADINPLDHYNVFGWHEGRDPSLAFDTHGYLSANPDVAAAGVNPLTHYLMWGFHEGRSAIADSTWA